LSHKAQADACARMGPTISLVDGVETSHVSLSIAHIFQWRKEAITEAYIERNQLKRKVVVDIKENVYLG
ncbi:MAG: hypothetical protein ACI8Q1_003224, partial [Parvicella sp.]